MFDCEGLLNEMYHDWPVCLNCGVPSTTKTLITPFKVRRSLHRLKSYECQECLRHTMFHPGYDHGVTGSHHCLLQIDLGALERQYIKWACSEYNPTGVHLVTWPDVQVRFAPILAYALFKSSYFRYKEEKRGKPRIIVHFSPKSPAIDEEVVREYERGGVARFGIASSLSLSPSCALGYLHICEHYAHNLEPCPIDGRFLMATKTRGGMIQSVSILAFVKDFQDWPSDRLFYVVTNEKFSLTGFTLQTIKEKTTGRLTDFEIVIIIDDLCPYMQESRISGLASFIQECINEGIPLIAFVPRSRMRFQLMEFTTMLNFSGEDLSIHNLDTPRRVAYLLENGFFKTNTEKSPACPYSTYAEVAAEW